MPHGTAKAGEARAVFRYQPRTRDTEHDANTVTRGLLRDPGSFQMRHRVARCVYWRCPWASCAAPVLVGCDESSEGFIVLWVLGRRLPVIGSGSEFVEDRCQGVRRLLGVRCPGSAYSVRLSGCCLPMEFAVVWAPRGFLALALCGGRGLEVFFT